MPETTLTLKANNAELLAKLKQSEAAVESLTAEVEKLEQSGEGGIELEGELSKLSDEAYNAKRALEATNQELAEHKQKTLDAAKAAEEQKTALGGLFDGLSKVQKVLGAAGLAILAFKESFNKTREAIRFFKENFGIDVDEMVKKVDLFGVSLDSLAERIAGLGDKQKQSAEAAQLLANQINVLDNVGIKHSGTVADVTAKYEEWVKSHRKVIEVTDASNAAFEKFQKTVTGFTLDELNKELAELITLGAKLEAEGKFEEGPFAEAFRERVTKATAALEALGTKGLAPELLEKFKTMRERAEENAKALEEAAKAAKTLEEAQAPLQKAIQGTSDALKDQLVDLREVRSEMVRAQGDILAQASDIQERIEEALSPDTSELEKLREEIARLKDEEADLATAFEQNEEIWTERARLFDLIAQKTDELHEKERAGIVPDSQALKKAQDDFRKLLDAAEVKLAELPESARGAAESIVRRFRDINEAAGVSAFDVRDFKIEFAGAMATARLEVGRLEDQAKVMMDNIDEAMKKFQDDMVTAAKFVTDALKNGPLLQLKAILDTMNEITEKAAPAMAEAMS